jgi:hypothetical protein
MTIDYEHHKILADQIRVFLNRYPDTLRKVLVGFNYELSSYAPDAEVIDHNSSAQADHYFWHKEYCTFLTSEIDINRAIEAAERCLYSTFGEGFYDLTDVEASFGPDRVKKILRNSLNVVRVSNELRESQTRQRNLELDRTRKAADDTRSRFYS